MFICILWRTLVDRATIEVEKILNVLIDDEKSPIAVRDLAEVKSAFAH